MSSQALEVAGLPVVESSVVVEVAGLPAHIPAPGFITEAMRRAAPRKRNGRQAYMVGALAAAYRRANPITAPDAWDERPDRPEYPSGWVDMDSLPYIASPIVEHIREDMPDLVMAADRGARFLGLAVFKAWHQRYPGATFPTIDGRVHFGRMSKRADNSATEDVIRDILHRSGVSAEMAQRRAVGDYRPMKVLLLEDWVSGGGTVSMVMGLLGSLGLKGRDIEFSLATLNGGQHDAVKKHIIGDRLRSPGALWSDSSEIVGVHYPGGVDDFWGVKGVRGRPARTAESRRFRRQLDHHIREQISPSPHPVTRLPKRPARQHKRDSWPRRAYRALVSRTF